MHEDLFTLGAKMHFKGPRCEYVAVFVFYLLVTHIYVLVLL